MTSHVIANGIKGSGTVAAAPVRIYEDKGNHILTYLSNIVSILSVVTALPYI